MDRTVICGLLALVSLGAAGCASDSFRASEAGAPATDATYEMTGFSWVLDDRLAGMPHLGRRASLATDLAFLQQQGITLLVSLTETASVTTAQAAPYGVKVLHLPVADFAAPTQDQLDEFVTLAGDSISQGGSVGVHCAAGLGRTGTFLATYLVASARLSPDGAIAAVRQRRPGSVETPAQRAAIFDYAQRHRPTVIP